MDIHSDPWSRPTIEQLKKALSDVEVSTTIDNQRENERLELTVPINIKTARGNTIDGLTVDISRTGIGIFHKGELRVGQQVELTMASETREFKYKAEVKWCNLVDSGLFRSGCRFVQTE